MKEVSMGHLLKSGFLVLVCTSLCMGQIHLAGSLSGELQDTTYIVEGVIKVEAGESLTISPGAELLFAGEYDFTIDGYLYAVGTDADGIIFRPEQSNEIWGTLRFTVSSSDNSEISYCYFTGASTSAINCYESDITISHSTFIENTANFGGGIYGSSSNLTIDHCAIESNQAQMGGGIYLTGDYFSTIDNCLIIGNIAAGESNSSGGGVGSGTGDGIFYLTNCVISNNYTTGEGGGVIGNCALIANCQFNSNEAFNNIGGGVYLSGIDIEVVGTSFLDNTANLGAGLYISSSGLEMDDCSFIGNTCAGFGGGIAIGYYGSSYNISNTVFEGNSATGGGAIFAEDNGIQVIDCQIRDNVGGIYLNYSNDDCMFLNCDLSNNEGSGFYIKSQSELSEVVIENCIITNNPGRGIHSYMNDGDLRVIDSEISNNSVGGVKLYHADASFKRCVIFGNGTECYGGGINCAENASLYLENCTVANNITTSAGGGIFINPVTDNEYDIVNTIVYDNQPDNIHLTLIPDNLELNHSDIYSNTGSNFTGLIPAELGVISTINLNGDSCDAYYNILLDPLFFDPQGYDYHLTENSPCIDAGDPALPFDPDATIADMGAFFFDQNVGINEEDFTLLPAKFALSAPYPNPCNSATVVKYSLAEAGNVSLAIYDVSGREVETLFRGLQSPGLHTIDYHPENLASGICFIRLQAGKLVQTQKIVYIK